MRKLTIVTSAAVLLLAISCKSKLNNQELSRVFDNVNEFTTGIVGEDLSNQPTITDNVLLISQSPNAYGASGTDTTINYFTMGEASNETGLYPFEKIYANSKEEVETVVLFYNTKIEKGYLYNESNPADSALVFDSQCLMRIVDNKTKKITFEKTFYKESPKNATTFVGPITEFGAQSEAFKFLETVIKK